MPHDMIMPFVIVQSVLVFCFHSCWASSHISFWPGASHLVSIWSMFSSVPHVWHSTLSSQLLMCLQCCPGPHRIFIDTAQ
ncbi:uncharacterized protein EV420DRAFT_1538499 [Desarmillaria tabescens]|uniref:Secreted protein n=1 Tax=Armillaria tabescens TaxID=1929756 RepID=A0AA39KHS7_ARMTA|nr:uncharacterized protein EV420DRAFT_1538499 [Desarmillaria tabescens]KAK0459133.1 hypothetical protein EV420DRAFT_1538499 [Desarmillaria tabescens]